MRKQNLKLSVSLKPSARYLNSIILCHSLSSTASLFIPVGVIYHLLAAAFIAASLCYQLNLWRQYSMLHQINFSACTIALKYQTTILPEREIHGTLAPFIWILPGLMVFNWHDEHKRKRAIPIFSDALSKDDYRTLRIFALRGPLLRSNLEQLT